MRRARAFSIRRLPWLAAVIAITIAWGLAGCQPAAPDAVGSPDVTIQAASTTAQAGPATETEPTLIAMPGVGTPGVFDDRVVFGQSAAFSGPASQLGIGMRLGISAAFAEANRNGGVHGRQLELVSLDDTYEPEQAIANTTRLSGPRGVTLAVTLKRLIGS